VEGENSSGTSCLAVGEGREPKGIPSSMGEIDESRGSEGETSNGIG
jgi:hypothetical protein